MSTSPIEDVRSPSSWHAEVTLRVGRGERFAGLFATGDDRGARLTAMLARPEALGLVDVDLAATTDRYPSLTRHVPAAFWYEREVHDLFGLIAKGHPRLDPIVLPLDSGQPKPRPGAREQPPPLTPHERSLPPHLAGAGIFTLPHGPVRSGVVESVEYLIETPGEDIPHLRVRPHHKHRGLAKRFEELSAAEGVRMAERVEGIASVSHALGYAQAVEDLAGVDVPEHAMLIRLVHAELERVANHLDVAVRLADAAALAVASARMSWHKERVLRLRSQLCHSRYGRGVVILGGVRSGLHLTADELGTALEQLERDITGDERAAMLTPSFLDRLRGTGPLPVEVALRHGALGPLGRASGAGEDVRASRPYGAYRYQHVDVVQGAAGDVQERLRVRWAELHESFRLIRQALSRLSTWDEVPETALRAPLHSIPDGRGTGWAEAPQGEVLYVVEVVDGQLRRVVPRSASFHNLPLFHTVFAGDIFTDFPFIEASFGLSIAGVAG